MVFSKVVPIISIWELKEEQHLVPDHTPLLVQPAEEGAD
jgi:hypothetical protein